MRSGENKQELQKSVVRESRSVPTHGVVQVFQEEFKSTALPQPRTAFSFEKGHSCLNVKNIFSEMVSCRVKIRLENVRQRDAALRIPPPRYLPVVSQKQDVRLNALDA